MVVVVVGDCGNLARIGVVCSPPSEDHGVSAMPFSDGRIAIPLAMDGALCIIRTALCIADSWIVVDGKNVGVGHQSSQQSTAFPGLATLHRMGLVSARGGVVHRCRNQKQSDEAWA